MNREKIVDNVLYIIVILSGLLCLVVSGKDIARTIIDLSAGEYWIALFDGFWAIVLFILGFRNIKLACKNFKTKFGS